MEVSGNQKVKATRDVVFQALLNPEVLKKSIPGCEAAELVDFPTGRELKLTITPNIPFIKGSHTIFVKTDEVVPGSHMVLVSEPSSSLGSIKARCAVDLTDIPEGTNLAYKALATLEGKIAATPELLMKGPVKSFLDTFFKNFEKQVAA